jgi:hypothetical protein
MTIANSASNSFRCAGNGISILPPSGISDVGAFNQKSGSFGGGLPDSRVIGVVEADRDDL